MKLCVVTLRRSDVLVSCLIILGVSTSQETFLHFPAEQHLATIFISIQGCVTWHTSCDTSSSNGQCLGSSVDNIKFTVELKRHNMSAFQDTYMCWTNDKQRVTCIGRYHRQISIWTGIQTTHNTNGQWWWRSSKEQIFWRGNWREI